MAIPPGTLATRQTCARQGRSSPPKPERPPIQESPAKHERPARQEWNEPAGSTRFELEAQPEMPSAAPPEPEAAERSSQGPKGFVVLAIGMPGSGKTTWFRRRGVTPLSSDLLRNYRADTEAEKSHRCNILFNIFTSSTTK